MVDKMSKEKLLYHAHDWVIKTDTYDAREQLRDFFDVIATDTLGDEEFVVAVEGKHYPVTGVMYHPETQQRHIVTLEDDQGVDVAGTDGSIKGKVNNSDTDKINYYFSEHIRREAAKTMDTHNFVDPEFGMRMEWLNTNTGFTRGGLTSLMVSYGF